MLGTQSGPNVYLGNPCWTFPASVIGTTVKEPVAVTNTGVAPLTISNVAITGTYASDFAQTNNCPASLNPGANCVIAITFTASVALPEWAYVMITDNAVGSPHNIYLNGVGEE